MHRTISGQRLLALSLLALVWMTGGAQAQGPDDKTGVLVVPINTTKQVEMSKRQLIMEVRNENPKVARVQTQLDNPRAVLVTGLLEGVTRITLVDNEKKVEFFDVTVPSDETQARERARKALLETLRKVAPTASVEVMALPNNTVILSGYVGSVDQNNAILETARSIFPNGNVVNALQVGGVQQVQLEVTVAIVNRSEGRNMAFSFFNNRTNYFVTSILGAPLGVASALNPGIQASASALAGAPNLAFGVIDNRNGFAGFLSALRTEGLAKILAEPKVVTLSGRPAYIVSGGETPILTSSGQGAPNVTYKQFGTVVNFLPIVLGNGKIHLEVRPELSNINAANGIVIPGINPTNVPGFDVRSAQVAVQMEDGQTLAIGGLIQNRVNSSTTKVPILGDLPFFGAGFRSVNYQETEEEMLILVTPRLVDPMACNQLPKYLPGRETRTPDDFELFLEGILEAPRGPRQVCCPHYKAAHRSGGTADLFPCGNEGDCMTVGKGHLHRRDPQHGLNGCSTCSPYGAHFQGVSNSPLSAPVSAPVSAPIQVVGTINGPETEVRPAILEVPDVTPPSGLPAPPQVVPSGPSLEDQR